VAIKYRPIRGLLIDYLKERQPALDFISLTVLAGALVGLFWSDLEHHHPGIDSLRLPADVAQAWKERIRTKTVKVRDTGGETVEVLQPRIHYKQEMITVRAFYRDIAHWAVEDPARWGPWAAPCPIKDSEVSLAKEKSRHKGQDGSTHPRTSAGPAAPGPRRQRAT